MREALTFDDVSCVPRFSTLSSRDDVDLTNYVGVWLKVPIMSAPMDSVTWVDMATFMAKKGGLGILHRYCSIDEQVAAVKSLKDAGLMVGAAVGINGDSYERAIAVVEAGVDLVCLDIAHGHSAAALDFVEKLKKDVCMYTAVMSANICTADAAKRYEDVGADCLRVGVGSGSACTTRVVAGVGVPQVTAIMNVSAVARIPVIADGGIRNSGDIVKAIAAGADGVIIGGMFAPYLVSAAPTVLVQRDAPSMVEKVFRTWQEGPDIDAATVMSDGLPPADIENLTRKKLFRGMASESALSERKRGERFVPEGEEFLIDIDYDFDKSFDRLVDGVRLGLAYLGAATIADAHGAELVRVTTNGYIEAQPHMMYRH